MSEEKQLSGVVLAISIKEEKSMFSLKIGELWVTGKTFKFKDQYQTISKGDKVDLSYTENEAYGKTFLNIIPGKLKITQGTPSEFKPAGDNAYTQREEGKREDILKSVSLKAGVETINNMTLNTGEEGKEVAKKVIEIAEIYYTWLKGEK